jgi:dephospho-CoA kinase
MSRHRIPRLGVTGGIGSGKSTATAYLRELGAEAISADDLVHGLLSEPAVVARIGRHFGDGAVAGDEVDRPALARLAFSDAGELDWLEGLLHPHVKRRIGAWAREQEARSPRPALLVIEIPLLFESGMEDAFDHVLLVTAPEATRRKRLTAKLTASEFGRRSARQLPEAEKAARSDYVFDNSGSRRRLKQFLAETYADILAAAARGREG